MASGICCVCQGEFPIVMVPSTPQERAVTGEKTIFVMAAHNQSFGRLSCEGSGTVPQAILAKRVDKRCEDRRACV